MSAKNIYNLKRRRWLIAITIFALLLLVLFLIGQFTPVLTAWVFKQAIDSSSFAKPGNFAAIEDNVIVKKDITYDEHGTLLDIYYPRTHKASLPTIMWIHGGGFIGGSKGQTKAYAMTLANEGYMVANINYDLAPGHKYPRPILQGNQALKYLSENAAQYGGDINRLFLGGNSSGSQIASQLAAIISNKKFAERMDIQPSITTEQFKGALLYDGAYNMQTVRATPGFLGSLISLELWSYTGVRHFESYARIGELSTISHVTTDYPPVFLAVGDSDPFESQSIAFKEVLEKNKVEVEAILFTGTEAHLDHDYMMNLDTVPAQQTLDRALDFLKRHGQ